MRYGVMGLLSMSLVVANATRSVAFEEGKLIDLQEIAEVFAPSDVATGDLPLESVAWKSATQERRWYVSGIAGASFASLTTAGGPNADLGWSPAEFSGTVNDTLFTGGGAIGMAIPRPSGALRVEFEGRGRDLQDGTEAVTINKRTVLPNEMRAADGWSTMVNFWRDIQLTERGGVYLGGGIGGGGYRASSLAAFDSKGASVHSCESIAGFAWQTGTGVFYDLSNRVAIDLGYRFMAIAPQDSQLLYDGPYPNGNDVINVTNQPYGTLTTAFSTSELLLSIRIYEPFRRWR